MSDIQLPDPPDAVPGNRDGVLRRVQPVLTLLIAVAAITLAIWEGLENRRHNRLTVQPRVGAEVEIGGDSAGRYVRLAVESTGLGPAVIRTFRIYLDGIALDTLVTSASTPWKPVIDAISSDGMRISAHAFGTGYFFPAGQRQILFEARRPPDPGADAPPLTSILDRVAVQICYCSIYGSDCGETLLSIKTVATSACAR